MIEFDLDRRKWLFVAAGLLCLLLAFGIVFSFKGKFGLDTIPDSAASSRHTDRVKNTEQEELKTPAEPVWAVYVTGAVMRPGVYEVAPGGRINDAVRAAGGFSLHADPEAINLAARLSDGAHIKVPEKNKQGEQSLRGSESGSPSQTQPRARDLQTPQHKETSNRDTNINPIHPIYPIDLNSATHAELCTLPGIGPKLASSIIEHRESNGPFGSVDDICQVRGIGAKKLEGIREFAVAAAGR